MGALSPPHLLSGAGKAPLPCKPLWGKRELLAAEKEQGKCLRWDGSCKCQPRVEAEAKGREHSLPVHPWGRRTPWLWHALLKYPSHTHSQQVLNRLREIITTLYSSPTWPHLQQSVQKYRSKLREARQSHSSGLGSDTCNVGGEAWGAGFVPPGRERKDCELIAVLHNLKSEVWGGKVGERTGCSDV